MYFVANSTKQIYFEQNISAEHAMITDDFGNECKYLGEPFINNCGYDLAKTILEWVYDSTLNQRQEDYPYNNVIGIDQQQFVPNGKRASSISMEEIAYIYVATNCSIHPLSDNCRLHILFHGCLQNLNTIYIHSGGVTFNDTLVRHAGFNQYAETNNLVILYPQASYSDVDPINPSYVNIYLYFVIQHNYIFQYIFSGLLGLVGLYGTVICMEYWCSNANCI